MKKFIFITLFITLITIQGIAQIIIGDNGIYFDSNNMPYQGTYCELFDSGTIKFELELKDGLLNGVVNIYHENGVLHEVQSYKMGEKDGLWLIYNEDSKLIGSANYKNNQKHGEWLIYDDNGKLRYELYYNLGDKIGTWKQYDESGNLNSRNYDIVKN
jgi:antitoxin component YwqK of YwqJK toxin-antitoxin module